MLCSAIGRNRHEDLGRSDIDSGRIRPHHPHHALFAELSCLRFFAIVILLLVENDGPSSANRVLS
jgi:hypothetical protein